MLTGEEVVVLKSVLCVDRGGGGGVEVSVVLTGEEVVVLKSVLCVDRGGGGGVEVSAVC